jgi:nitrate reductase gamma subunit
MAVLLLILVSYLGVAVAGLQIIFGVVIPYLAVLAFLVGVSRKVMDWARSPVPFRITTTAGQQKSLPWIAHQKLDNPFTPGQVVLRMLLEVLLFRSLFRNTRAKLDPHGRLSYSLELFLWVGALAFHYSFLTVLIRHLRFFSEPVLLPVQWLEKLDGFIQIGLPNIMLSGLVLLAAVFYLFLRRLFVANVKFISLAADYFPLFLIFAVAFTGVLMRYFVKVDVVRAKQIAMGLVTLHPTVPEGVGAIFYIHLFLVCVLLAYFPFSKLMHMAGIFLSPTRNLPGNSRAVRHINPWNYPVEVHTYEEYEEEFRGKMIEAGLPVEKEE